MFRLLLHKMTRRLFQNYPFVDLIINAMIMELANKNKVENTVSVLITFTEINVSILRKIGTRKIPLQTRS